MSSFFSILFSCFAVTSVAHRHRFAQMRAKASEHSNFLVAAVQKQQQACPCQNQSLCAPLKGPPVSKKEVFGFVGAQKMNWTHVTSVAWSSFAEIGCEAHANNARVILASPDVVLTDDASARLAWITNVYSTVEANWMDGMTFDWENPTPVGSNQSKQYALLIAETRKFFQSKNPSLQISTCVAWSPDDIDGRGYDMYSLYNASDFLYVMDYDTRSEIFDHCIASANAPVPGMLAGLQRYQDLGIPFNKLVLGMPWYGYRYACLSGTSANSPYCPIEFVPFRGVNCSDAAGMEVPYSTILNLSRTAGAGQVGWDENMHAPWFNLISPDGSGIKQYWFDNQRSLSMKAQIAKEKGLLGIGPFTFSDVDDLPFADSVPIWSSFDPFFA